MYYLGVDIGGTSIKAGVVDQTGHILKSDHIPTIVDDLDRLVLSLTQLIRTFQDEFVITAIGMGIPGLLNSRTQTVRTSPNIPCLKDAALAKSVSKNTELPVVAANDANAAAYAEFTCGFGRGYQHLAFLTLGTGLGSGVILNGKLFTGSSGYAVEFGHAVAEIDGRPCSCGSHGCFETLVSATGMVVTATELMRGNAASKLHALNKPLTSEKIFEAASSGDATALRVFELTGKYLGIACASLINIFNPDLIAIGGGVVAAGEMLLGPARAEAKRRALKPSLEDCWIVQSKLGPDAGIIGAAMLARDQ